MRKKYTKTGKKEKNRNEDTNKMDKIKTNDAVNRSQAQ